MIRIYKKVSVTMTASNSKPHDQRNTVGGNKGKYKGGKCTFWTGCWAVRAQSQGGAVYWFMQTAISGWETHDYFCSLSAGFTLWLILKYLHVGLNRTMVLLQCLTHPSHIMHTRQICYPTVNFILLNLICQMVNIL